MNPLSRLISACILAAATATSATAQSAPNSVYGTVQPHPILDSQGDPLSPPQTEYTTILNTSGGKRSTWLCKRNNTLLFSDVDCSLPIGESEFLHEYYEVWRNNDVVLLASSTNPMVDASIPDSGQASTIAGYAKQVNFLQSKSGDPSYRSLKTESHVDKKALVVHKWEDNEGERAALFDSPYPVGNKIGEVNLYEILFVFAESEDADGQTSFLVGRSPFFLNEGAVSPSEYIRGWLSSRRVFPWNHRECVEFNKAPDALTWRNRNGEPIRIFSTSDDAFKGDNPLFEEDMSVGTPMTFNQPRYPIMKSDDGQHQDVLKAGIIGDSYSGDHQISADIEAQIQYKLELIQSEVKTLDVLLVIDASGSMHEFFASIDDAIAIIQDALKGANDIRYAVSFYRDYTEDEDASSWSTYHRDFLPPTEFSHLFDSRRPEFINSRGGLNNPCVFAGILEGVESVSWREGSTRAVILIGDMGNTELRGGFAQENDANAQAAIKLYEEADARGIDFAKVQDTLAKNDISTFTAIQVAPAFRATVPQIEIFYDQANKLSKGYGDLSPVLDAVGTNLAPALSQLIHSNAELIANLEHVLQLVKEGKPLDEAAKIVLSEQGIGTDGGAAPKFRGGGGVLIKNKVLELAEANGIDIDLLLNKRIQNFSFGYAERQFPDSPFPNFEFKIFMQVGEVESLLAALRLLERQPMTADNVDKVWRGIVNALIGEHEAAFTFDEDMPLAEYFSKSLGLPTQSPYLKKSIRELKTLEPQEMADWHESIAQKVQLLSNWLMDKSRDGTHKERHVFAKNGVQYIYIPIEFFP